MKRFLIALALLVAAGSASACVGCNIKLNGTSENGISLNGWNLNGISLNGISLQGARLNGISLNGKELLGRTFDTAFSWQGSDWSAVPLSQVQVRLPQAR